MHKHLGKIRLTGFARVCETHIVLKKEDRMTGGTGFFKPLMSAPRVGTGLASAYADFIAFDTGMRPRPAIKAGRGLFVCAERGARQGGARGARCIAPVLQDFTENVVRGAPSLCKWETRPRNG